MKKLLSLILAALLVLSMAACAADTEEAEQTTESSTETEAVDTPVDLQALYDTLAQTMPEMIVMDENMMLNYCGIDAADCNQAIAAICLDSMRTDEIWLIEAVDEEALSRLESLAQTRLKMKGEETVSYSPEQYAVVEKAQIITNGLYLILLVSPDVDTLAQTCNDTIG